MASIKKEIHLFSVPQNCLVPSPLKSTKPSSPSPTLVENLRLKKIRPSPVSMDSNCLPGEFIWPLWGRTEWLTFSLGSPFHTEYTYLQGNDFGLSKEATNLPWLINYRHNSLGEKSNKIFQGDSVTNRTRYVSWFQTGWNSCRFFFWKKSFSELKIKSNKLKKIASIERIIS